MNTARAMGYRSMAESLREKYMSEEDQDRVAGRLRREFAELSRQVGSMASELNSIGRGFAEIGRTLQATPPYVNVDKASVDGDLSKMWDLVEKHEAAQAALDAKTAEMARANVQL